MHAIFGNCNFGTFVQCGNSRCHCNAQWLLLLWFIRRQRMVNWILYYVFSPVSNVHVYVFDRFINENKTSKLFISKLHFCIAYFVFQESGQKIFAKMKRMRIWKFLLSANKVLVSSLQHSIIEHTDNERLAIILWQFWLDENILSQRTWLSSWKLK